MLKGGNLGHVAMLRFPSPLIDPRPALHLASLRDTLREGAIALFLIALD